ncbi:hypothetical protein QTA57_01035 [Fontisubflavum oceani]|uniref:hypothetical protein n=1 Tax=Fontisubflavum oceani TaxID=2978973 RepID=UPI0025B614C2|nr:hypothetical protein [Fontisubflavum oceani]WJY21819.1 hypothetical protein QTA57_01035 [Fontisubflavum oceani]
MLRIRLLAIAGPAALVLAGCAQPPEPQVARAMPLFSKSGEALCVPSDPVPGTNYSPNIPNCDEVCEESYTAGANVAICPPVYDRGRQPIGDDGDDSSTQTGGRGQNAAGGPRVP